MSRALSIGLTLAAPLVMLAASSFLPVLGSPGPLDPGHPCDQPLGGARSHAELESRCEACHAQVGTPGGDMSARCVHCHADLESDRVALGDCAACHAEHEGAHPHVVRPGASGPAHRGRDAITVRGHENEIRIPARPSAR